ncbi:hypothetical protein LSCM1_03786 [Leishmania martiniquensis]|uniref:Uncharacterized protein n=1 Tax=Leishmania martiniquensis TaxID=1580590 RepID=A0A836KGY6_9TRYP|nr:hypothetical protein LSCM1_03786 [Leishmania martiniquensis]
MLTHLSFLAFPPLLRRRQHVLSLVIVANARRCCTCLCSTLVRRGSVWCLLHTRSLLSLCSAPENAPMGKRVPTKRGDAADVAGHRLEEVAGASALSSTLSPRTLCQQKWAKRVDNAVIALRHVQQLLQQHTTEVDTVKRELEDITYTAAMLWAANPDELPAQYRDKYRPSYRRNSSASSTSRPADATPTAQRSGPDIPSLSASLKGDAFSGISGAALESVEQALLELSTVQRAKVSAALQSLFYAPPIVPPVMDSADDDFVTDSPATAADHAAQQKPTSRTKDLRAPTAVRVPSTAEPRATASITDGESLVSATGRYACIPPSLFLAMKELQMRRVNLEAQLTTSANATAQQLQRFRLLQEELMVSQYGLDAARRDPKQTNQRQRLEQQREQQTPPEDGIVSS